MDGLMELSAGLSRRVAAAAPGVAGVLTEGRRPQRSGFLWSGDVLVTSEQGLPEGAARAMLPGGDCVAAVALGRDSGTNLAVFRLETAVPAPAWLPAPDPAAGSLAIIVGADGAGGPAVRLGLVNSVGPAWTSMAGGVIDRLIRLDCRLAASEEGGPVLDAAGALVGMSTLGPRRRTLVIPFATIVRVVTALLATGRVPRGWLGLSLHPVALPPALHEASQASTGLMVMGLAPSGPGERAGLLPGDILLALNGVPAARATMAAPLHVGSAVTLRVLRAGQVQEIEAIIGERPAC